MAGSNPGALRISVVMAYYNRRHLLLRTLQTICRSAVARDCEVIVVDDGSRDDERVDDLQGRYPFDLRVIRVDARFKSWTNPCVPLNVGFRFVRSDLVVLQNPECLHVGDILLAALRESRDDNYLAFGCYSADRGTTEALASVDYGRSDWVAAIRHAIAPLRDAGTREDGTAGWYNHSVHKPTALNFCTAIRYRNLVRLGGFDERFAYGMAFDDAEWLYRVTKVGLGVRFIDDPFVIHQFHGATDYGKNPQGYARNHRLFEQVRQGQGDCRVQSVFFQPRDTSA